MRDGRTRSPGLPGWSGTGARSLVRGSLGNLEPLRLTSAGGGLLHQRRSGVVPGPTTASAAARRYRLESALRWWRTVPPSIPRFRVRLRLLQQGDPVAHVGDANGAEIAPVAEMRDRAAKVQLAAPSLLR